MTNYNVSPERFIEAWQSSQTLAEFCEQVGMSGPAASARAGFYRRRGLPLKRFKAGKKALDISRLQKIVEEQS